MPREFSHEFSLFFRLNWVLDFIFHLSHDVLVLSLQ